MENYEENTGRGYNDQGGLGGNLVPEGNVSAEGEDQYNQNQNENDMPPQNGSENSFHVGQYIEKMQNNPEFSKKKMKSTRSLMILYDQKQVNPSPTLQGMYSWLIKFSYYQYSLNSFSKDLTLLLYF